MMTFKIYPGSYRKMLADALNPYRMIISLFPIFGISSARAERIRWLAEEIRKDLLKTKKVIDIQDVMEAYKVNAVDAYESIKLLKEEGILTEID